MLARFEKHGAASSGDWGCVPIGGYHEKDEVMVAKQFTKTVKEIDAKFILNMGDNFYYCGVHSKTDAMWNSTFENIFTDPATYVTWWGALGNHDYGYPGSATAQMEYESPYNNRWQIPDRYYYKRLTFPGQVNISLVTLDASPCQADYISSNPAGWDPCGSVIPSCPGCTFHQNVIKQNCSKQLEWLNALMPTIPQDDWKILMVHAPASDLDVEDFVAPFQQYNFELFINGHVHLMAHYQMDNQGTYITTGAACMVRIDQEEAKKMDHIPAHQQVLAKAGGNSCGGRNPWHSCSIVYQRTIAGYSSHTFNDDFTQLTTYLWDYQGNLLHSTTTTKGGSPAPNPPGPNPNPPGPNTPSPPSGACCHYAASSCTKGETCCSDEDKSYKEYECVHGVGKKHHCIWTGSTCIVG